MIEQQSGRRLPVRTPRRAMLLAGAAVLAIVVIGLIVMTVKATQASRAEEAELLAAFRRETAAENATFDSKIAPDRVVRLISAPALAHGLDLAEVTGEIRSFQSANAQFQAIARARPAVLRKKLAHAGLSGSRQRKVVEAFEASRSPSVATSAFLLRHELGEEVLSIAELLERRRGAWRIAGDELVFSTNADRKLYERAVERQQEIQRSIPDLTPDP